MATDEGVRNQNTEEERPSVGCNVGCLLIVIACLALDVLAAWAAWQVAQGIAWLVSLMAYA